MDDETEELPSELDHPGSVVVYTTHEQLVEIIRARTADAGSMVKLGRALQIAHVHICMVLNGRRRVGKTLAEKLGYKREVVYVKR